MNKQRKSQNTKDKTKTYQVKRKKGNTRVDNFDSDRKLSTNDPSWYSSDPALLRDSATIPFSWAIGTPINLGNATLKAYECNDHIAIPGVAVQYLLPSVGRTEQPNDPLNVAANSMYSFVRHANSGHSNYNSPDLMIYTMAMSQVYSYINFLQRLYGTVTLFSQRNRYMPEILCKAMGVDYDSLRGNLAAFRYYINVFINKAASMAVPNNMNIFKRHAFLYQNIYSGGSTAKEQMYMYSPKGFWRFQWNDETSAGELVIDEFWDGITTRNLEGLIAYGENLLNPIIRSEDMNIMSGDILKAYGNEGILKLTSMPEYYPITPIYDIAFLEQFKNATVVNCAYSPTFRVYHSEDVGYLMHLPQAQIQSNTSDYQIHGVAMSILEEKRILTTVSPEPTPELVMENSRLMVYSTNSHFDPESKIVFGDLVCGTEVAAECILYGYKYAMDGVTRAEDKRVVRYNLTVDLRSDVAANSGLQFFKDLNTKSKFKFAPAERLVVVADGTTEGSIRFANADINYDVDNYAVLNVEDIERMHGTAILNLLNVPAVARFR